MKLFEWEAKEIAREFGILVPNGILVTGTEDIPSLLKSVVTPLVIKAQVLGAGRMKTGGILFASTKEEAKELAGRLSRIRIQGESVSSILIEEKVPAVHELYAAISVDRENRCYLLLASMQGGSEIEELAEKDRNQIVRQQIDPLVGLQWDRAETVGRILGYTEDRLRKLTGLLVRLYEIAPKYDTELVEVNPLIETPMSQFVLADFKMIIDDNSLFRHPEFLGRLQKSGELTNNELQARKSSLAYVELDGNIGVLGNGAGLVMATLDLISQCGGSPANFCDVGGGADAKRVEAGIAILVRNEKTDVLLLGLLEVSRMKERGF